MGKIYYFDNAATSHPKPEEVAVCVYNYIKNLSANPGRSSHKLAIESAKIVFNARENIAEILNYSDSEHFIFTLNATDSINIVLNGYLKKGDFVLTTFLEHNSVLRPLKLLEKTKGIKFDFIKFSKKDGIDFNDFYEKLKEKVPSLVVINHASNVTGKIVDLDKILELKDKFKFKLLIDGAQTGGIYKYNLEEQPIDFIAFTGHKSFYGPQGIGFLFIRDYEDLLPLRCGGTGSFSEEIVQPEFLPDKFESGTLNVPGIAGLNAGINFVKNIGFENIYSYKKKLVNYFIENLKKISQINLYSDTNNNSGIVSFNLKNIPPSEVARILDKDFNIAVRPGLHCAPLIHKCLETYPQGCVRFSFSHFNTIDEIDYCINALKKIK